MQDFTMQDFTVQDVSIQDFSIQECTIQDFTMQDLCKQTEAPTRHVMQTCFDWKIWSAHIRGWQMVWYVGWFGGVGGIFRTQLNYQRWLILRLVAWAVRARHGVDLSHRAWTWVLLVLCRECCVITACFRVFFFVGSHVNVWLISLLMILLGRAFYMQPRVASQCVVVFF